MAKKSEPGALDLLVNPGWFAATSENEAANKQEDMETFIDQLISQVEIPELPIPPTETTAAST